MGYLVNRSFDLSTLIRRSDLKTESGENLHHDVGLPGERNAAITPSRVFPLDFAPAINQFAVCDGAVFEMGIVNLENSSFDLLALNDVHEESVTK